ncbi:TadE/TadG family type IV pilus assembly protein [Agrobacterium deltaense]|uniref:TadE/TadG family type IV pilus assembly protein n=1 Tax=Agrobacterium deltaense TaxID=1183412 RepID=UPI003FD1FB6C
MKSVIQKFRKSRSGASAVEFALVMPVFLLMLFGMIEFGRLFWTSHALHDVAIATVRCMGIPQMECEDGDMYSASKATAFARTTAAGWFVALDTASITLDHDVSCHGLAGFSQVKITHEFKTVMPALLTSLAGGTKLQAKACYTNH